eukprot:1597886-Pyramimonas_sp.AAC.1
MRRDWAKRELPSNRLLEYCQAASNQGATNVIRVSEKWNSKTAHRAVISALGWPEHAPDITWIDIPIGPEGKLKSHPVICPVQTFQRLVHHRKPFWEKHFGCNGTACMEFWKSLDGHPIADRHPALRAADMPKTIP